jgi:hypothetical protein
VASAEGQYERAASLLAEGLARFQALANPAGAAGCLDGLACVAVSLGYSEHAALLAGAAEVLRASVGEQLPPADRQALGCALEGARFALGERAFTAAWARGAALPPGDLTTGLLTQVLPGMPVALPPAAGGPEGAGSSEKN